MSEVKKMILPRVLDDRGNISFIENFKESPFEIKRAYLIYDIPGGEKRGSHAFLKQHEIIIALSGSFDVEIISKNNEKSLFTLNRSYEGLLIPSLHWRTLLNFSTNSVCLVLSSELYDESDYIRDFDYFLSIY